MSLRGLDSNSWVEVCGRSRTSVNVLDQMPASCNGTEWHGQHQGMGWLKTSVEGNPPPCSDWEAGLSSTDPCRGPEVSRVWDLYYPGCLTTLSHVMSLFNSTTLNVMGPLQTDLFSKLKWLFSVQNLSQKRFRCRYFRWNLVIFLSKSPWILWG